MSRLFALIALFSLGLGNLAAAAPRPGAIKPTGSTETPCAKAAAAKNRAATLPPAAARAKVAAMLNPGQTPSPKKTPTGKGPTTI